MNHQRISEDSLGGLLLHLLVLGHKLLIVLLVVLLGGQVLSSLGIVDLLLAGAGTTEDVAGVDLLEVVLLYVFVFLVSVIRFVTRSPMPCLRVR